MALHESSFHDRDADAFDSGLNILFLAGFPLVLWLFRGSAAGVAVAVLEMVLFSFALRLISTGQKVHHEYDKVELAARPKFPRKIIGSGLIGIVVAILAAHQFANPLAPLLAGLSATGLSLASFGLDPMSNKGMDDPEVLARMKATAYLHETEDRLVDLCEQVATLGDADLTMRTDAARDLAMRMARAFNSDPEDLRRFSRPMDKFVEILGTEINRLEAAWEGEDFLFARRRYTAKLQVLCESFEERARKGGAKSGKDAFDMEADLLLDRMPQENAA